MWSGGIETLRCGVATALLGILAGTASAQQSLPTIDVGAAARRSW
jgi:hypothetical protein